MIDVVGVIVVAAKVVFAVAVTIIFVFLLWEIEKLGDRDDER